MLYIQPFSFNLQYSEFSLISCNHNRIHYSC
nr:MAG TPA: hypothetical protein [Caudoviricetes sp.]